MNRIAKCLVVGVAGLTGCASGQVDLPVLSGPEGMNQERAMACLALLKDLPQIPEHVHVNIDGSVSSVDQGGEWLLRVYNEVKVCLRKA